MVSKCFDVCMYSTKAKVEKTHVHEDYHLDFWEAKAKDLLAWISPFKTVLDGCFEKGTCRWFHDGMLNASYNCIDRHDPSKVAIIWHSESGQSEYITFGELKKQTCQFSSFLSTVLKVQKGDRIVLYLPMIPEAISAMLACARIGAIHNVVFAGFSSESLKDRILDSGAQTIITADVLYRGGKTLDLLSIVKQAIAENMNHLNIIVIKRFLDYGSIKSILPIAQIWDIDCIPYCQDDFAPIPVHGDLPLFILYTSGSTGKPKGIVHNTAGYLLYATFTSKLTFDLREGDRFGCMADLGWITGHSYIVYGPLSNGVTTFLFEGTPYYPDFNIYWKLIEDHKLTQLYTSPTVIRALKKTSIPDFDKFKLDFLRVIGTVGEPIDEETSTWLYNRIGKRVCSVVDTYWQTETGGHIISTTPGIHEFKPGFSGKPIPGISIALFNPEIGSVIDVEDEKGVLLISKPWPGMLSSIWGDHSKCQEIYFNLYKGFYFTGDSALRDKEGFYSLLGRVDDVINVAGHRLCTAEIESAANASGYCSESAAIGYPDEIKGQVIWLFCIKSTIQIENVEFVTSKIFEKIRSEIGSFACPSKIFLCDDLPKTRSGKIMRRLLRKISLFDKNLGDLTSLNNPNCIEQLVNILTTNAL